jgi:dipeptidyl-peptidase III
VSKLKIAASTFSNAAWHGTRISLRQVPPESEIIYDFILRLYSFYSGDWNVLVDEGSIKAAGLERFLNYAATLLSNVGNHDARHPCGQSLVLRVSYKR